MRYPAEETAERHARILNAAARLFREKGYGGVNVAEIMGAAGLTHGGFYAHFDSKDALAAEAIDEAFAEMHGHLDAARQMPRGAQAFLAGYLSKDHLANPGEGCLVAALGPEIARGGASLRARFTAQWRRFVPTLAALFPGRRQARRHSIQLFAAMVGALVLARAVDDAALQEEILTAVRWGSAKG